MTNLDYIHHIFILYKSTLALVPLSDPMPPSPNYDLYTRDIDDNYGPPNLVKET